MNLRFRFRIIASEKQKIFLVNLLFILSCALTLCNSKNGHRKIIFGDIAFQASKS